MSVYLSLGLGLIAGCGGTSLEECVEGSPTHPWGSFGPRLTGAPVFSASDVRPGATLTLRIPVDEEARNVSYDLLSSNGVSDFDSATTEGGTTVVFEVNTNLPPDRYWLSGIQVSGETLLGAAAYLATEDPGQSYIIYVTDGTDRPPASCETDVSAPSFSVTQTAETPASMGQSRPPAPADPAR